MLVKKQFFLNEYSDHSIRYEPPHLNIVHFIFQNHFYYIFKVILHSRDLILNGSFLLDIIMNEKNTN